MFVSYWVEGDRSKEYLYRAPGDSTKTLFLHRRRLAGAGCRISFGGKVGATGKDSYGRMWLQSCLGEETEKFTQCEKIIFQGYKCQKHTPMMPQKILKLYMVPSFSRIEISGCNISCHNFNLDTLLQVTPVSRNFEGIQVDTSGTVGNLFNSTPEN